LVVACARDLCCYVRVLCDRAIFNAIFFARETPMHPHGALIASAGHHLLLSLRWHARSHVFPLGSTPVSVVVCPATLPLSRKNFFVPHWPLSRKCACVANRPGPPLSTVPAAKPLSRKEKAAAKVLKVYAITAPSVHTKAVSVMKRKTEKGANPFSCVPCPCPCLDNYATLTTHTGT